MVLQKNTAFSYLVSLSLFIAFVFVLGACRAEIDSQTDKVSIERSGAAERQIQPIFDPAKTDWPHTLSDIDPDPRAVFGRLPNGLRYIILPVPDTSGAVSIKMSVGVGFQDEPKVFYGIAHVLEHMAFRGARGNTETDVLHDMDAIGAAYVNGATTHEVTYYQAKLADYSHKDLGLILNNLSQIVTAPNLTKDSLDAERKVVIAEKNLRDTEKSRTSDSYFEFLYPNEARYTVPGIGTYETLSAVTLADVEAFYKTHYQPDNTVLYIAGDVSVRRTKKLISKLFKEWPVSESAASIPAESEKINLNSFPEIMTYEDASKSQINLVQNTVSSRGLDMKASLKKDFEARLALAMMRERLRPLIDKIESVSWINLLNYTEHGQDIRAVKIGATDYPKAVELFERERLRAIKYGFTKEEISFALTKERAIYEDRLKDPSKISSWREVNKMLSLFNGGLVYISDQQAFTLFDSHAKTMSRKDYHAAIKTIWEDFTPRYWGQGYSENDFENKVSRLKKVRAEVALETIQPPADFVPVIFEKAEFSEIGKVKSRDVFSDYKIQRLLFENGARLNYIARKDEPNSVQIYLTLAIDPGTVRELYSAVSEQANAFSRADILGMTKLEMDKVFAGRDVNFNIVLREGRLVFIATTNTDDLKDTLGLLATFLEKFDIQSEDYKKQFEKNAKSLRTAKINSPLTLGFFNVVRLYSGDNPSFQSGITGSHADHYDEALTIFEKLIKEGRIEVGIVGDFDPDFLEDTFARSLGALSPRPLLSDNIVKPIRPVKHINTGVSNVRYFGDKKQMALFYCWPGQYVEGVSHEITQTLSGQIVGNRITQRLRQDLGLTYSPRRFQMADSAFPEYQYMCFMVQITPEDEQQVHENIKIILDGLENQFVTKTEFSRARNPLLSEMKGYWTKNASLAFVTAFAFSEPKRVKEHKVFLKQIEKTSLKQIRSYFSNSFEKQDLQVFRIKNQKIFEDLSQHTLATQSALGYDLASVKYAKLLIASLKEDDRQKGWDIIEKFADEGDADASFEMGRKLFRARTDYERAAQYLEIAQDPTEGAFILAEIYFRNPKIFPDITNERIIALYTQSSESGYTYGQKALSQRYKDGSMVTRDEVQALKWALLATGMETGLGTQMDANFIERYTKGMSETDQEKARAEAIAWREKNPDLF